MGSQQRTMELIINRIIEYHVSSDIVNEFEQSILSDSEVKTANQTRNIFSNTSYLVWKIFNRYDFLVTHEMGSLFKTIKLNDRFLFCIDGPRFSSMFAVFYDLGTEEYLYV